MAAIANREKQLIRLQLENQAALIYDAESDGDTAQSVLEAANSLIAISDRILPETTEETLEQVSSEYLLIANQVVNFYKTYGIKLDGLAQRLAEEKKRELDKFHRTVADRQKMIGSLNENLKKEKEEVTHCVENIRTLEHETKNLKQEIIKLKFLEKYLKEEHQSERTTKGSLEESISLLSSQLDASEDMKEELMAYYELTARFEAGVAETGFVNMEELTARLEQLCEQGKAVMTELDKIMKAVCMDLAALQKKVASRQRTIGGRIA